MSQFSLLVEMFVGKQVRISHTGNHLKTYEGLCMAIYETPHGLTPFDIKLDNGYRFGFVPGEMTETSCNGPLNALAGGTRKVELI